MKNYSDRDTLCGATVCILSITQTAWFMSLCILRTDNILAHRCVMAVLLCY